MNLHPIRPERSSIARLTAGIALAMAIAVLFALPQSVAASNDPTELLDKRIEKLIDQLGDKSFHQRQKAQAELLKIGFPAIDALNEAANHDDLEIAERARFLVKLIPVELVLETDSPLVRTCLRDYEDLEPDHRLARIKALASLSGGTGMVALCRLVRFEKSPTFSKQAALAAMFLPDADDAIWPKRAKQIMETLDSSRRPGAKWLRTLVRSRQEPEAALAEWEQMIVEETAARELSGSGDAVLVALLRREVLLLEKLHRHEQALTAARKQISYERGTPETLMDLLGWLTKQQLWEMVDEVTVRFARQIDQNIMLLYTVAEARAQQGKKEDSEKLADRALKFSTERLDLHLEAALHLQEEGRFAWMEREFRALLQNPLTRPESLRARLYFSEHLHDQGQERAAADVLMPIVAGNNNNQRQIDLLLQSDLRTPEAVKSRMHYFSACAFEKDNRIPDAIKELHGAIGQDATDADVLIALYRLTMADKKEHAKVVLKIQEAADTFRGYIDTDPEKPTSYNQFAWLIANTEGDFDEAIRNSHKSLELRPGEAGYLDTLGHCYFAKGDYENAVTYEGRAVEVDPYSSQLRTALERFKAAQAKASTGNK